MNKTFLSGNLTKDPEVKYTTSGKAYARAGIAVNRRTKKADGTYETDFFDLCAWDKTAEFMGKYLKKGSRVIIDGRIESDNYKDKTGSMHYGTRIVVENIEFGESKKAASQNREHYTEPDDDQGFDADVPF